MKYSAAIFDMDGTILDTLADLAASLNHALAENGLPERSADEVRSFVGNGIRRLVELAVPEGTEKSVTDGVFAEMNRYYALHCWDCTAPYSGITEALSKLRRCGIATAVVSNKPDDAVRALCARYFDGLFDCAAGAREDVGRKPCPDSVNAVLAALGVEKSHAVYIGDSEVDVETAKNAGIALIAVDWGFRSRRWLAESGAETIVSDAGELLGLLGVS